MRYFRGKSLSCDDFRGIAISPIISKVFEHCILNRFQTLFLSCDSQFGFKKGTGCRNAIYAVRNIVVDECIKGGDTVNVCAIGIGAGAIELAGARAPKFLTAGEQGAQQNLWGTFKKIKRLMKKPSIRQRKCSACHPLATDTLPLVINSFVDHTLFYVGADSQTPLQFVDILYRSLVNAIPNQPLYFVVDWIQVWYTRVDGRKYLNTFQNC